MTIPGARYGLISAVFVVFTLVITDFGVPKVIGGQFNVLATDIYKQVVGQQNFQMGAVVGLILLLPAVIAFAVDQVDAAPADGAALGARGALRAQAGPRAIDRLMLIVCSLIALAIVIMLAVAFFASLATFWPYNLTPSLKNYDFDLMDGGGWASYYNSLQHGGAARRVFGTAIVFTRRLPGREDAALQAGARLRPVPGAAAARGARARAGPRLHLLLQQPVQPAQLPLRHHGDPGDLHRSRTSTRCRI